MIADGRSARPNNSVAPIEGEILLPSDRPDHADHLVDQVDRDHRRGHGVAEGAMPFLAAVEDGVEPDVGDAPMAFVEDVFDEPSAAGIVVRYNRRNRVASSGSGN